jgi:hypothetical protein
LIQAGIYEVALKLSGDFASISLQRSEIALSGRSIRFAPKPIKAGLFVSLKKFPSVVTKTSRLP